MIYDRTAATHIIGSLVQNPSLLVDSDKYALSPLDFTEKIHSILFSVVNNLYFSGVVKIDILVIEDYLKKDPEIYETYLKYNGTDFLIAATELAEVSNFDFYYDIIKKMTLLRDLKENGFNIQDWYVEDIYDISKRQQMELKLEKATIKEILQSIQNKLYGI
jgi:replicative DNA helicase